MIKAAEGELSKIECRRNYLVDEIGRLRLERASLSGSDGASPSLLLDVPITERSPQGAKIALFRSLFRGRDDVHARRFESLRTGKKGYQPACRNEWVRGRCQKPRIPCDKCTQREPLPVTDEVIRNHLLGVDPHDALGREFVVGIYPMLPDETCWFLAADFDKTGWRDDARAFLDSCRMHNVPAVLERSRSGNGGHIWVFFAEPIPAALARKLGAFLTTQTMQRRPELGLDSYDRFFPSQDTLPEGGFGNLIGLPLQRKPRENGDAVFIDGDFAPYPDQWAFLSSIHRMARHEIDVLVREAEGHGELLGIRLPVTDEEDSRPWTAPASGGRKEPAVTGPLPEQLQLVLGNQVYIPKEGLSPSLRNRLIRLAAFQNPEFYRAEAMRLSTYGKPRIISCCEEFPRHLALPRGCLDQALELLASLQVRAEVTDERFAGTPIDVQFHGTLRPEQLRAAEALLRYDTGVLAASTAFGKTVIGAYLIAQRRVNTLVIVHRRQLLDQWIGVLGNFLGLESDSVGQIGGGRHKPTARLDVAMIQSLSDKGTVSEIVGEYGQLIVDECHHISAVSFERVVRQSKARYVTGLSATVVRRDGHHPVIFMQCGPLRFRVADRKHAGSRPFRHRVIVRLTGFHVPEGLKGMTSHHIHELYSMLAVDEDRNRMIVEDVVAAIKARRSPLLLTERRDHLETLVAMLAPLVENVIVMTGGMRKRQRDSLAEKLASISPSQERVIVATGRYLGEGFDDSRLDTLFLALPISWRGTLTQYAGRLHRLHADKQDVIVFDYVDSEVRVLAGMYAKRRKGYKAIGYEIDLPGEGGKPSHFGLENL
ncbi:MAG: DEAD/DEAH box helicase [Chloroflexi bacterium]|nr:DEAD/DEAH box helicase [Chloroflexota bacterium]